MNWFNSPRKFGSSSVKPDEVLDCVHDCVYGKPSLFDMKTAEKAFSILLGKDWSTFPARSMMDIVNHRLSTKSRDYRNDEVTATILLLLQLFNEFSPVQLQFITKYDHLPKAVTSKGHWMDGDELLAYEKTNEDAIHQRKMEFFLMSNGILQAWQQSKGKQQSLKPEKKFSINPTYIIIAVVVAAIIVLTIL